mgnify:CR=1 FL=1
MRKKSKKQQDKARRQQQRETIKNLHRQLNDVRIQLNQYQGMHAAHLDELSRVANTKEQEVTEKYQPQVAKLKSQLADNEAKHNKEMTELTAKHKADLDQLQGKINAKDAILSKEVAESQEAKRQAQSLQQQMTEQSQKLAAIIARDAAHGEELERHGLGDVTAGFRKPPEDVLIFNRYIFLGGKLISSNRLPALDIL